MLDIEKYRNQIEIICKDLELGKLGLIGSAARGDLSEESDIDVIVTFRGSKALFKRYFDLKERLESVFGRSVDVIEERAIKNPYFLAAVNKDRFKVYEN